MCVHGNLERGDCHTCVWAGLAWRVRPPTKVSSFPPVFLVLFCFFFFLYIYFLLDSILFLILSSPPDTMALLISEMV